MPLKGRPGIPGVNNLEQYPLWGLVALGCRGAERSMELLEAWVPPLPSHLISRWQTDIAIIKKSISQARPAAEQHAPGLVDSCLYDDKFTFANDKPRIDLLIMAIDFATKAALSSKSEERSEQGGPYVLSLWYTAAALKCSGEGVSPEFRKHIVKAIRHDVDTIEKQMARSRIGRQDAMSLSLFGPLWPFGAPEGWPREAESDSVFRPKDW